MIEYIKVTLNVALFRLIQWKKMFVLSNLVSVIGSVTSELSYFPGGGAIYNISAENYDFFTPKITKTVTKGAEPQTLSL